MPKAKQKDFISEEALLQQVIERRPEPCMMKLGDWNDAVSMMARFNRCIRHYELLYRQFPVTDPHYGQSPYAGLTIQVFKPGTLLFQWVEGLPPVNPVDTGILDGA
jgi:hypothetical protein